MILATHEKNGSKLMGIFSARGEPSVVRTDLPDGIYENLLGGTVDVFEGTVGITGEPVILRDSKNPRVPAGAKK